MAALIKLISAAVNLKNLEKSWFLYEDFLQ